jgi:hypothetical protein
MPKMAGTRSRSAGGRIGIGRAHRLLEITRDFLELESAPALNYGHAAAFVALVKQI